MHKDCLAYDNEKPILVRVMLQGCKGDLSVDQTAEVFVNILKQPEKQTSIETILSKARNYF
jgi:hypothetical protein